MGCRSQVAFAAQGPKANIVAALTTWRLNPCHPKDLQDVMSHLCLDTAGDRWTLSYQQSGKWYDNYTDVQMFTQLSDLLRDDEDIDTAYIRVGEDDTDVETTYSGDNPYDLLELHRYVSVEAPVGKPLTEAIVSEPVP